MIGLGRHGIDYAQGCRDACDTVRKYSQAHASPLSRGVLDSLEAGAAGDYSGDTAVMDLHKTTGVTFAGSTGTSVPFGKLTIEFENCSSGLVTYNMNDGRKGSLPMTRLIPAPEGCK